MPRGVAGQHFRDQKNLLAPPGDRLGDHQFGITIHLGGVDVGHAEIDATAQRCDRALAVAMVDIPGALPDHGNERTVLAEFFFSHDCLSLSNLQTMLPPRHCERSEAIHSLAPEWIASSLTLLAMTRREHRYRRPARCRSAT